MIKIKNDIDGFVNVMRSQEYSSHDGSPELGITISGGPWKDDVEHRLSTLENQIAALISKDLAEEELRRSNAALLDAWEKYQLTLQLVKDHQ